MDPEDRFLSDSELDKLVDKCLNRDSDDISFPQKSYALGGAGKTIIYSLLFNDWFLTELLLDPDRSTTDFYIIDTATENKRRDNRRAKKVSDRISTIDGLIQQKANGRATPDINVETTHLKEEIQVNAPHHFLNEGAVEQILRDSQDADAETWWITKDILMDGNDMLETSKGVTRRRALSKAFFYKTQANTDFVDDYANLVFDDEYVAIFAGLGGGTGSGMAIDLARLIRQVRSNIRITLFGILPCTEENDRERANAYAALSELEYLALSDNDGDQNDLNPFGDVILTPIEKTGYTGRKRNTPALENFDEAYPHVPIAYYNAPNLDGMFQTDTDYAPFTIAIPKILRYDVRSRIQDRKEAEDTLESKSEALEYEGQIYDGVGRFLSNHYEPSEDDQQYLYDDHEDIIEQRFDRIEQFVDDVVPGDSNISLEQAYDRDGDYVEKIESIRDYNQAPFQSIVKTEDGEAFGDEGTPDTGNMFEDQVVETIEQELENVVRLYELLKDLREVGESSSLRQSNAIREVVEFLLDPERTNPPDGLAKRLDKRKQDIGGEDATDGKIDEYEKEMRSIERRREQRREQNQKRVNEIYRNWQSEVEETLQWLEELESIDFRSLFEDLESKFNRFVSNIETADKAQVQQLGEDLEEEVRNIDSKLKEHGVSLFEDDKNDIIQDIHEVKRARKEWLNLADSGGWFSSEPDTSTYKSHYRSLSQSDTFLVPGHNQDEFNNEDFYVQVNYDPSHIQTQFRKNIKQGRKYVVSQYDEIVGGHADLDPDPEHRSTLQSQLKESVSNNRNEIEEGVREAIETELIEDEDDTDRIEELEELIDGLRQERERLAGAQDLMKNAKGIVRQYQSNYGSFVSQIESNAPSKQRLSEGEGDLYLSHLEPDDSRSKYQQRNSLSELDPFRNGNLVDEAKAIREYFERAAENDLVRSDFTGIENRPRSISRQVEAFSDTEMNVAYVSDLYTAKNAASTHDMLVSDVTEWLATEYNVSDDGLGEWYVGNGDPWEFGMTVFIQGLAFLDNLAQVTDNKAGYKAAYASYQSDDLSDLSRHAYGLERGFYLHRENIHRPTNNRDMYIDTDIDTAEQLLQEITISTFSSTVGDE